MSVIKSDSKPLDDPRCLAIEQPIQPIGIGKVAPPLTIAFHDHNGDMVGHMHVNHDRKVYFEGDFEESARLFGEWIEKVLEEYQGTKVLPLTLHTREEIDVEALGRELKLYERAVFVLLQGLPPERAAQVHERAAQTWMFDDPKFGKWHKQVTEALRELPEE